MTRALVVAMVALSGAAWAGGRDFIAEHSGAGANSENAQPYIDQFLRVTEQVTGWPANSAKGEWVDDAKGAEKAIAERKPGFAILDPEVYFELRKKDALEPIGVVKGKTFNKGHYSLVVKDPALKSLADLKGKKLASNHLASPKYISKVAFEGKIDVTKEFTLLPNALAPSKPIKAVSKGEADAALIDDEQLAAMKDLAPDLKVIWTSPALPPTPLVVFTKNATPADKAAFAKALPKLCEDKGKAVCESMFIDKFAPVDKATFADAAKRYDK